MNEIVEDRPEQPERFCLHHRRQERPPANCPFLGRDKKIRERKTRLKIPQKKKVKESIEEEMRGRSVDRYVGGNWM